MTEPAVPQGDKNGNLNCLDGVECPQCGEHDVVDVTATMWVRLRDDGTEDVPGDTEYDNDSPARCPSCGHEGTFGEWQAAGRCAECGAFDPMGDEAAWHKEGCSAQQDTCDRCEKPGRIHVGHEQEYGYDGLCDSCLDSLAEAKQNGWPIP